MGETELESLKKVEIVNELIKKLASNNGDDTETFNEVDEFLNKENNKEKTGFNKTSINRSGKTIDELSSNEFMKSIELDAKERAERKAESRKKAEKFKITANDYFKACDFKKAIELYSKAIAACNDWDVLYTNRAQAYIKRNEPQMALDDCDIALRLSERNHKALLHKGRALVRMNRFEEATTCYKAVLELAPNLKKYLQEFFDEADQLRQIALDKETSLSTFEGSNSRREDEVDLVIKKLLTSDCKDTTFYSGGIQLLIDLLDKNVGGIDVLRCDASTGAGLFDPGCKVQEMLQRIMARKCDEVSECEWSLVHHWMDLCAVLVKNSGPLTSMILNMVPVSRCLDTCLKWATKMPVHVLLSVTALLYHLSATDIAVQQIFDKFSLHSLLALVIRSIDTDKHHGLNIAGIGLFKNLVASHRFKIALGKESELINTVIDCLYSSFASSSSSSDSDQISSVISIIESLADNSAIRIRLIKHDKFLNECMTTIEAHVDLSMDSKHADILLNLFTFIHNLLVLTKAIPTTDKVRMIGHRVVQSASTLISANPSVEMRSILIQVLSQMLVFYNDDQLRAWCEDRADNDPSLADNVSLCRSLSRRSSLTDQNYLDKVCETLRLSIAILDAPNHPLLSSAVKILTLASRVSEPVLFLCCDVRERTLKLQSMIYKEKELLDDTMAGNICLLLINSVAETPLAEHLASTSIMKDLLRVCTDANKNDCRRNAAILAGKLAQSSHVHKTELSRLNGFSIIAKFNTWS